MGGTTFLFLARKSRYSLEFGSMSRVSGSFVIVHLAVAVADKLVAVLVALSSAVAVAEIMWVEYVALS